jgi:inward rectifier potassium channel
LGGDVVANARPGSFLDAFFFSVQTFSTIGYGSLGPSSLYADILVTIESFIGLVSVAIGTGLIFAKFARPSARIAYSNVAVIHEHNGVPTLQFRIANERTSEMLNASIKASILMEEVTAEGQMMRRFHELQLVRDSIPMFSLAFVMMHQITEDSPLYGLTPDNIHDHLLLLITSFEGTDTTFLQTVQARYLYRPQQIRFNEQFVDLIGRTADGRLLIQHEKLNETKPFMAGENEVEIV